MLTSPRLILAWAVATTFSLGFALTQPGWVEDIAPLCITFGLPFVVSLATGAALTFLAWTAVSGPPVPLGSVALTAVWIPAITLPAFASLAYGAYAVSRLFRGALQPSEATFGATPFVLRTLLRLAWVAVLLVIGWLAALPLMFLMFSAIAAHES